MADTIKARVTLRASQALTVELKLGGTPSNMAFQNTAYQNDAFQTGGFQVGGQGGSGGFRNITLLSEARPM